MKEIGIDNPCSGAGWEELMRRYDAEDDHAHAIEEITNGLMTGKVYPQRHCSMSLLDALPENGEAVEAALVALLNRPGIYRDKEIAALASAVAGGCVRLAEIIIDNNTRKTE